MATNMMPTKGTMPDTLLIETHKATDKGQRIMLGIPFTNALLLIIGWDEYWPYRRFG